MQYLYYGVSLIAWGSRPSAGRAAERHEAREGRVCPLHPLPEMFDNFCVQIVYFSALRVTGYVIQVHRMAIAALLLLACYCAFDVAITMVKRTLAMMLCC